VTRVEGGGRRKVGGKTFLPRGVEKSGVVGEKRLEGTHGQLTSGEKEKLDEQTLHSTSKAIEEN